MTFQYNNVTYELGADSTYRDLIVPVSTLEDACTVVNAVVGMTGYTFNGDVYSDMIIRKKMIVIENNIITVRILMREQTELEITQSELALIKDTISRIDEISDETASEYPYMYPDYYKVDEIHYGCRYLVDGVVVMIEEPAGQETSNPATGGGGPVTGGGG